MNVNDDRTPEQKQTHRILVVGTDACLSGWGLAEGGKSYAAWACTDGDLKEVLAWVEKRSDMRRVRVIYGKWTPKGTGHAHIYVVKDNHPAVARKRERELEFETYGAAKKFEPEAIALLG